MQRAVVALVCAVLCAALPAPARAQTTNGQLAVVLGDRIVTVNPDGSGRRTLYTPPNGAISDPVWSPDGNRLAFIWDGKVAVLDVANPRLPLQLSQPGAGERDADPGWSATGDSIGFRRVRALSQHRFRVAAGGGSPAQLGEMDALTSAFGYAPDLSRWAYTVGPLLYISTVEDFAIRASASGSLAVSRDGTGLVYFDTGDTTYERGLTVVNDVFGTPTDVRVTTDPASNPRWAPDGQSLAYVDAGAAYVVPIARDAASRRVGDLTGAVAVAWQPCVAGRTTVGCESAAPPTCTPTAVQVTTQAGQPVELPPRLCSDPAGRELQLVVITPPEQGTLDGTVYTPRAGFIGQDTVSYRVSNGVAQSELVRVSIFVVPRPASASPPGTNPPPAAAPYLSLRVRPKLDRKRTTLARLSCDQTCTFTVRLEARLRAKNKRIRGKTVKRTLTGGRILALRLKLPAKPKGALKQAYITGTVRGANGRSRPVKLPVTVRR